MQTLHLHLIPVAALLMFSIASCSSSNETNREREALVDNTALLAESDSNVSATRDLLIQATLGLTDSGAVDAGLRLNSSNYEQIAKSAVQAINLTGLNTERDAAHVLLSELNQSGWAVVAGESALPGLTLASQESISSEDSFGDYSQTYTCDDGGMLTVVLTDFNGSPVYHHRANFDNCQMNGQTHNGSLEISGARRAPDLTIFTNYTRSSAGQNIAVTGTHEHILPFFGNPESNSWTDTVFVVTNSTGTVKVDNINWQELGQDDSSPDSNQGFVLLPDGSIQYVVQNEISASLQAILNFTPAHSPSDSLSVAVNLSYESSYFDWAGHHQSGFELPTSPVSSLGNTINVYSEFSLHTGTSQLFESLPRDSTPQWQDGGIRITASDASSLILKPDPTNIDVVLIELNGSGEQISKLWANGYQVACPILVGACGQPEGAEL